MKNQIHTRCDVIFLVSDCMGNLKLLTVASWYVVYISAGFFVRLFTGVLEIVPTCATVW